MSRRNAAVFVTVFGLAALGCGGSELSSSSQNVRGGEDKAAICHIPPGNPANAHVVTVGAPAVAAHVANHGDTRLASDLRFARYLEGCGNNKMLEIRNRTCGEVELKGYAVRIIFNGGTRTEEAALEGNLAHGRSWRICNSQAEGLECDQRAGSIKFNGTGDRVELVKNAGNEHEEVVDSIGEFDPDNPGDSLLCGDKEFMMNALLTRKDAPGEDACEWKREPVDCGS